MVCEQTNGGSGSTLVVRQTAYRGNGEVWERAKLQNTWSDWQRIDNYGTTSLSELASALGDGSDAGNLVIVRNSFEGDIYQGLDIFKQQILTWYQNLPSGSIIVAKFNYPGNGVVFGIKASNNYGNFVMLSDGTESYKYINVSGGNISTNITL